MTAATALSILGGSAATTSSAAGGAANALAALRRAVAPGAEEKGVAQLAKDPVVKQDLARFRDAISRAKDVSTALKDPRVAKVLLPALGLPDAVDQTGLAARALTSNLGDSSSLANRLSDTRWKDAAASLNLSARGMDALRDPSVQKKLEDGYLSYRWRASLNEQAPGVADALYVQERAATGETPSVYEVLGNSALRRVVTGALGLPDSLAVQTVEAQARAVTSRLNLASLADPKKAAALAERYVMTVAQQSSGTTASPILALLA